MTQFVIAQDLIEKFPDMRIGVVTVAGMHNGEANDEVEALKQDVAATFRKEMTSETLAKHPYILAWRETYRRFGVKPSDHRPTAEALLRRIVKGEAIPRISTAVDLYLAIETEFYLPIGGYDLKHVVGDIQLRFSSGDEAFFPIGSAVEEKTAPGEVVYADAEKVLTRRWNYRDCDAAKITQDSRDIVLFCEATLPEIPTEHLQHSIEKLAEYLRHFCGGNVVSHMVEAKDIQKLELTG